MAKVYRGEHFDDAHRVFKTEPVDIAFSVEPYCSGPPADWHLLTKIFCSDEFLSKLQNEDIRLRRGDPYMGTPMYYKRSKLMIYNGEQMSRLSKEEEKERYRSAIHDFIPEQAFSLARQFQAL